MMFYLHHVFVPKDGAIFNEISQSVIHINEENYASI
jgi:hypothetical protein